MKSFGNAVVKARHLILILAFVLLVPAVWGYTHTRVNYDILTYLPDSIETIKGQDILMNEFGTGAITMLIVEDKNDKEIVAMEDEIRKVDHVKKVLWYDSFADITIPKEMLPERIRDAFIKGNATMLAITYDSSTSSDETMAAVTGSGKCWTAAAICRECRRSSLTLRTWQRRRSRSTWRWQSCCHLSFWH